MTNIELIKGSDLRLKLKKRGILSVDLCRAFGYSKTTVSRYFTDDMQMSAIFVIRVAAYAGLNISDLIEGKIESPKLYRTPDEAPPIAAEPQTPYINAKNPSPTLHRITELYDMMEEIKEEIDKIRADMQE